MKRYYDFLRGRIRHLCYQGRGMLGTLGFFGDYNPPVFLVGTPNSGTTIFADGVSAHPEIRYGSNASTLWHKNVHFRGEPALKEAGDVTPTDRIRLQGNFSYYQWRNDETYIMNRNARNSFRIHYIKEMFPDSLIIHIVRDGRAVVRSNYQGHDGYVHEKQEISHAFDKFVIPPDWDEWTDRSPLEQYSFMWNKTSLYASREGKKYPDNYLEFRYENLEDDGEDILKMIWSSLGLNVTANAMEHVPNFENRNYKWKEEFDKDQIKVIENTAREGLAWIIHEP